MDNYLESLETQLINENDIIKKIDILNELSWELRRTDREKSLNLSSEAFYLSSSINYENGMTESYLCKAVLDGYTCNSLEFLEKAKKAYETFERLNNINGKIKALNSLGFIYNRLGKNDKSLECYLEALPLAKNLNNINMIIFLLNNIGETYKTCMDMYESSLVYFFEAIEYCKSRCNSSIAFIYNNIGDTYLKLGNTLEALENCEKGLIVAKEFNDKLTEAQCYKTIGKIYNKMTNKDKTIDNFNNSLVICQEINDKFGQAEILMELGIFNLNNNNFSQALDYMIKALIFAEEVNAEVFLVNIHHQLANIYEKTNEFEKSVMHFKKYIELNAEITNTELEKKLNALSVNSKMQQAEKDAEIYKLKNVELKEKSEDIEKKAKQLEESYKNIAVISDIGQKITSSLDIETIMNTIYENVNTLMDATGFGIGLYDEVNKIIDYKMFIENSRRIPRFITNLDYEKSFAAKCIIDKKEVVLLDMHLENEILFIPDSDTDQNELEPRSLIYYPLMVENKVIGIITVQSYKTYAYTEHDLDTMKALASYIAIALNNSHKSEELRNTADKLQCTLKNLQEAQEQLINSEKMVALGQLISGIAHEINTPLGAIQASICNISEYMEHTIGEKLPRLFTILDSYYLELFFDILKISASKDVTISSRDERKFRNNLYQQLQNLNIENFDYIADNLVDMGIYDSIEKFAPLLRHPENQFIIQTTYELSGILRNIKNMDLAVGKASKMLYALKSYSHINNIESPIEMDITESIDTILALYHNNIKQGTELIKNYKIIPKIKCFPDDLNQVWTNLIHNALQAMDYKGTLEITLHSDDDYVIIEIRDSGKGIPNEIMDKIFDPFFTTKRQGEGSGLGLGIVKKIINKHKGVIEVESIPGKTTFTVKLPINTDN